MANIVREIDVRAAPESVFALLTDLDRLPDWATIVVETRDVSHVPLTRGCTFRQTVRVLGQELETDWQVTELEPGRRVAYEATGPAGGRLTMTQTVTALDQGSRVRLEIDYDLPGGLLGELVDHVIAESRNEEEADRSLRNLKELLDG